MARVIAHAGELFDEIGRAWQSPELGLVAVSSRSPEQRLNDELLLGRAESGFGARRTFTGQSRLAPFHPGLMPPVSHLPGHLGASSHFGHRQAAPKHFGCLPPSLFHLLMISLLCHARERDPGWTG